MGATPWTVRAPFRKNIEDLLAETRARVFLEGTYRKNPSGRRFATLPELDAFYRAEPPENQDALDAWLCEAAVDTASILDIIAISEVPEPACAAPLKARELRELLGTEKPSSADLTPERESAIYERIDRGAALYVIVYRQGKPSEVVFYGYSND